MSRAASGACQPVGTTGQWWAASGESEGWEQWTVDLGAYAGKQVEVSLTHASDDLFQYAGVVVDDITVSFAARLDLVRERPRRLGGVRTAGRQPAERQRLDRRRAGADAAHARPGGQGATSREQPEIIRFLSGIFGRYPFSAAGGIVDDADGLGFALENQTRPIYSKVFFGTSVRCRPTAWSCTSSRTSGSATRWRFPRGSTSGSTRASRPTREWLWSEHMGRNTAQEFFDFHASTPADDPFWSLTIGDPGPDLLFEIPVYDRGAMTLHALRLEIGDAAFFRLLREWVRANQGGNVAIPQFIDLAERISGRQLDAFFTTWLFTGAKPAGIEPQAAARAVPALPGARVHGAADRKR